MTQRSPFVAVGMIALALALVAAGARAQPSGHPALPPGHPAVSAEEAHSLQGNDAHAWISDPHVHAFYDATRAAFAAGPSKVDVNAYEQTSFAIFREFGASMGMSPQQMQDHLKLIPRQVVQIVKEDPTVLDSYDNFVAATFGPQ
jgi:hypothetical protein